jgi:hypothetical protein
VCEITFSPDSKAVAYEICESLAQNGSLVFVAEAATGRKLFQLGEFDGDRHRYSLVYGAVFTPDGKAVACSGAAGPFVTLHEVATGKVVSKPALAAPDPVVGFTSDGRSVLSWGPTSPKALLWERATGKVRRVVEVARDIDAVLLSPDGRAIATKRGTTVKFHCVTK